MYKKFLFAVVTMMITATMSYGQFKMEAGKTDIGLRFGAPFLHVNKFSQYEKFDATMPAVGFTWETGIWNFGLSIGGEFNYATFKNKEKTGDMSVLTGMVYAKYYPSFLVFSKFAPYARLDLLPIGVYKISTPNQIDSGAKSIIGIYAGANYQFAEKFGVFLEVGTGFTMVDAGLTWRVGDN